MIVTPTEYLSTISECERHERRLVCKHIVCPFIVLIMIIGWASYAIISSRSKVA